MEEIFLENFHYFTLSEVDRCMHYFLAVCC